MADVRVRNEGSLFVFSLDTQAARDWRAEHIPEDAPSLGVNSFVAEHRFAYDIAQGMIADGLEVE